VTSSVTELAGKDFRCHGHLQESRFLLWCYRFRSSGTLHCVNW